MIVPALTLAACNLFGPSAEEMRRAQAQVDHGDYATGIKSFSDLIDKHPRSRAPREARLNAAMLWIRNYHISGAEGKDLASEANAQLSPLIALLEADSSGLSGAPAATIAAHLGWAHFLRFRIAEADVPGTAEPYFRQALQLNDHDVYANAMLGNWLLQTKSQTVKEAMDHFHTAIETGQERDWVRSFELGGLMSRRFEQEAQRELIKLCDEMRKSSESIDDDEKRRILGTYSVALSHRDELANLLSAVPPDDSWATYIWLDDETDHSDPEWQQLKHTFVLANIDELAGRTHQALALYKRLAQNRRFMDSSTMGAGTREAIKRLEAHRVG